MAQKNCQTFFLNFSYRFVGKFMESDICCFICYFSPMTPQQGSKKSCTPTLDSREPVQHREVSRVRRWC